MDADVEKRVQPVAAGFAAAHQRFDRFRQSVVEGVGVQFAVESPAFVVAAAGKKPPYRNRLPAIEISRLVEMPRIALVRQHGVEVLLSACFFVDVNGVGTVGIDRRYEEKGRGQGRFQRFRDVFERVGGICKRREIILNLHL